MNVPFARISCALALWWSAGSLVAAPSISADAVEKWNALGASGAPRNAETPSRFSVDHAGHRVVYNFQAPGIAIMPLADAR